MGDGNAKHDQAIIQLQPADKHEGMRKLTLPLLDQLQLDHNYLLQEDGFAEGKYLAHIKIWIYFGEVTIEKKKVNKCIDAKLHPIKLNF